MVAAAPAEEERVRYGGDLVMFMMLGGGIMFTLLSVAAWTTGRRAGALVLAVIAGANFAFALGLLTRGS
jgi:fatty acid desaturase